MKYILLSNYTNHNVLYINEIIAKINEVLFLNIKFVIQVQVKSIVTNVNLG
jgi:hypothetical protein